MLYLVVVCLSVHASHVLHERLLESVLFADIRFHNTVSHGRLLNRFGRDIKGWVRKDRGQSGDDSTDGAEDGEWERGVSDTERGRKYVEEEKDTVQKEEFEVVDLVSEGELNI